MRDKCFGKNPFTCCLIGVSDQLAMKTSPTGTVAAGLKITADAQHNLLEVHFSPL